MTEISATVVAGPSGTRYPRKLGYDYYLVTMEYKKTQKFGMMVKNAGNPPIVLVSAVAAGSMCDGYMKEMDRLLEVSSEPVVEREQCKQLILKAFKGTGRVVMFIERAASPKAIHDMETLMNASLMMPSVEMRSDVRDIAKRFNAKVAANPAGQQKGILRPAGLAPAANVKVTDKPTQQLIAADMSCRIPQLQKVPQKKAPPPPPPEAAPAPTPAAPEQSDETRPPVPEPTQERPPTESNSSSAHNEENRPAEGGCAEVGGKPN